MLELVLRTPEDKPPFVGICFDSTYEASKTNVDLIDNLKKQEINKNFPTQFTLRLEAYTDFLNINVHCNSPFAIRSYEKVKYSKDKLEKWMRDNRFKRPYNFAHLLKNGDTYTVALTLPDRHKFTFKVEEISVIAGERLQF